MNFQQGTKLGPYEIVAFIGAGGMGEVYRARDSRLGRDVAIKVLHSTFFADKERLSRFEQEARTASSLNHPNLVAVYDIGVEAESPYLVMEFLEGETLREKLQAGALSLRQAIEYAHQISDGLVAAHEKGVVHRDLKPENLFVTSSGRLKILDFGLAKQAKSEEVSAASTFPTQTEAGVIMGTAGYISPEQIRGLRADAKSDIFAFGAILYEMISGRQAFHGNSFMETISMILTQDPLEYPESNAIPRSLHRILKRCLEKDPAERFQSIRDVAYALEAVTEAPSVSSPITQASSVDFTRLTFSRGYVSSARFTPDGTTIVYGASWKGDPCRLFLVREDGVESLPLTLPPADLLSMSPSGEMALLLRSEFDAGFALIGTLARSPMIGGAPREVMDGIGSADWLPDGKTLALIRLSYTGSTLEFPAGHPVIHADGWISRIRVSRDGKYVAFVEHPFYGDDSGSIAITDTAGNKRILSADWSSIQGLAWSPDGKEVWFAGARNNLERSLQAVDLHGQGRTLLRVPSPISLLDVSPEGRALIARENPSRETFALTAEGVERDLTWLQWTFPRDISRDGKQLLFMEQSGVKQYRICVRSMDGGPTIQMGLGLAVSFSPNQKWILIVSGFPIMRGISLIPTGVGAEQDFSTGREFSWITLFPDENSVLVNFTGDDGKSGLHVLRKDRPPEKLPVKGPDVYTFWIHNAVSPNSKLLAGWDSERRLRLYSLEKDESQPLPGAEPGEVSFLWSEDGTKIYTYRHGGTATKIWCTDIVTGEKQLWKEVRPHDSLGVQSMGPIILSPRMDAVAYSFRRLLSDLYIVDGL